MAHSVHKVKSAQCAKLVVFFSAVCDRLYIYIYIYIYSEEQSLFAICDVISLPYRTLLFQSCVASRRVDVHKEQRCAAFRAANLGAGPGGNAMVATFEQLRNVQVCGGRTGWVLI
jgi:uncharacterized membrane protein